ncbi:hypothetical protein DLH72_01025 [Candidatus Gracilibacteria bacterium]|nr:MAG: hypothetical protein DLH72_01025 [Candidatus Gracilibacteria bacterium]
MTEENIFSPEFIPFYVEEVRKYKLSPTEGLIYGFIRFYTKLKNNGFFFKSEQLSEIIQVSSGTIDNCIGKLKEKGLLKVETKNIGFKKVRKIFLNFDEIGSSSFDEVMNLTIGGSSISLNNEIKKNNINNNKKLNKEKNIKKEIFGELENVKLSLEEKNKLIENYGEIKTNEFIEKLSLYLESKGDKYKSHYATILTWMRKENIPKIQKAKTNFTDLL